MTKSYLFKMMIKKGEPSYSHRLSYEKIKLNDIIKYKCNNIDHYCKVKSLNPVVIKITKLEFVNQKFFVIHEEDDNTNIDAYLIIKKCEAFIVDNDQLM